MNICDCLRACWPSSRETRSSTQIQDSEEERSFEECIHAIQESGNYGSSRRSSPSPLTPSKDQSDSNSTLESRRRLSWLIANPSLNDTESVQSDDPESPHKFAPDDDLIFQID